MRLKHYQEKVLKELKEYLSALSEFKVKYERALDFDADVARDYNFPKRAWERATGRFIYHSKTNSLNEPLPDTFFTPPQAMNLMKRQSMKKQALSEKVKTTKCFCFTKLN